MSHPILIKENILEQIFKFKKNYLCIELAYNE